jgi:pyruvate/2-oxoglutarate dehydrogenase complex dihydrolipoamide acyltransferase (E2) component
MSEYIFKLPDLGEGTVESEIAEWMVKVGDTVKEEDPICSMLTDKAAVELSSPVTGTVVRLAGEVGDVIQVGTPLIVFETAAAPAAPASSGAEAAKASTPARPAPRAAPPEPAAAANEAVRTSPSVRRQAEEAGIDLARCPAPARAAASCRPTSMLISRQQRNPRPLRLLDWLQPPHRRPVRPPQQRKPRLPRAARPKSR